MFRKLRHTVEVNGHIGTLNLQHHLDCKLFDEATQVMATLIIPHLQIYSEYIAQ